MFYYLIVCRYCWICKFIESLILSPPPGNGSDFAFDRGALDNDQLARVERASLQQGRIVVGGSHPGDIPIDGTLAVSGHAYTLMHSTDKAALFTMRNLWGGNPNVDGSADGIVNIPDGLDIPPLIDLWRRTRQGGRIWFWGCGSSHSAGLRLRNVAHACGFRTDASGTAGRRFRPGWDGIGRQLPADAFLEGMVCVWERHLRVEPAIAWLTMRDSPVLPCAISV